MGAGHDGQKRLSRRKHPSRVCGKNMEKVCIVHDINKLYGEKKMILIGYEFGGYVLRGWYDNGDRWLYLASDALLCGLVKRRCEQDTEGVEQSVVFCRACPKPAISENSKVVVESVP